MKKCSICTEDYPATTEYFYKHNKSTDGLFPYCKSCAKAKSVQWGIENPELKKTQRRKYNATSSGKEKQKVNSERRRENGEYKEWQQNNPDKVKHYREKWKQNKEHEISKYEWERCKKYFNNECAYCGISEIEAKDKYNNVLHKEHVDHTGANDLSNCVPSCKSCNGSKSTKEFDDWYNYDNPNFTIERFERILDWLNDDFYKFIEQ